VAAKPAVAAKPVVAAKPIVAAKPAPVVPKPAPKPSAPTVVSFFAARVDGREHIVQAVSLVEAAQTASSLGQVAELRPIDVLR
jgi:hypothetical protein